MPSMTPEQAEEWEKNPYDEKATYIKIKRSMYALNIIEQNMSKRGGRGTAFFPHGSGTGSRCGAFFRTPYQQDCGSEMGAGKLFVFGIRRFCRIGWQNRIPATGIFTGVTGFFKGGQDGKTVNKDKVFLCML
jgi:hypothetical protein